MRKLFVNNATKAAVTPLTAVRSGRNVQNPIVALKLRRVKGKKPLSNGAVVVRITLKDNISFHRGEITKMLLLNAEFDENCLPELSPAWSGDSHYYA